MAFEKWDPQPEFERFPASATIVQSRLIRLPTPVALMLRLRGKSNANLYFDKKRKVIGIRALDKKEDGAAKIRQSDKSTSLHVPSFFRFYDIDVPGIKRFHCWYDEKERMAMIDISRPSPRGRPSGT
ncbi:MAG: hypothetical protein QOK37_4344 [Thermoanaerobaculia bacterium]|jgi:hypothetical protein|nr:hypothetical protein [Thermoanaerobaculia bacterium]